MTLLSIHLFSGAWGHSWSEYNVSSSQNPLFNFSINDIFGALEKSRKFSAKIQFEIQFHQFKSSTLLLNLCGFFFSPLLIVSCQFYIEGSHLLLRKTLFCVYVSLRESVLQRDFTICIHLEPIPLLPWNMYKRE